MTTPTPTKIPIAREDEYNFLISILGQSFPVSSCVVISGPPGSGKRSVLNSVLQTISDQNKAKIVQVSCLEAYPSRCSYNSSSTQNLLLFDMLLYHLKFRYCPSIDVESKCDHPSTFIESFSDNLRRISHTPVNSNFVVYIVLQQAEKLRDCADYLLPVLVNLNFLVSENYHIISPDLQPPKIVTILLTSCLWDKFYSGTFFFDPIVVYFKSYTRQQLADILLHASSTNSPRYVRFVDLLLTVCLSITKNVEELLYLAQLNWKAFDEPVSSGRVAPDDEWSQWRHALPTLKRCLSTIYLRPELEVLSNSPETTTNALSSSSSALELPYFTRFLLLAAYLASYNPKTADKRFLVKNTGKMSARAKRREKKTEHVNNHLVGPRLFPLDRLLAIFYALLDLESEVSHRPSYTSLLASQVASLSGLGLIAAASNMTAAGTAVWNTSGLPSAYSNPEDPLANPRYRCLMSLETARAVAKSVDININAHLLDFA